MISRNSILSILLLLTAIALHTVEAQHDHGGGQGGGNSTGKSNKHAANFTENPILTNGTLFYIAISLSAGLWCTGFGLDYVMDRHEKQADSRAFQKYTQVY